MISMFPSCLHAAWRSLRRQRAFAAVVAVTLALGIGANAAMFALVYETLLRPLPYKDADRLVMARRTVSGATVGLNSTPDFLDYREQATSFEALVATQGISLRATLLAPAERVMTARVSPDFLAALGVQPVAGRTFQASDGMADAAGVTVIGERLARRRFDSPEAAVGQAVSLGGIGRSDLTFTVIGVLPSTYRFMADADVWTPMRRGENDAPQTRNQHRWMLVGRLKAGVALPAAQQEVDAIAERLERLYPASNRNKGLRLDPLQAVLSGPRRPRLILLTAAVSTVLLVACANVAGLLLARGARRSQELAVRIALGATRARVAAHLLAESALFAALGGAGGALLALWLQRLFALVAGTEQAGGSGQAAPLVVLPLALSIAAVTALLFGVAPALSAARTSPAELGRGGRTTGSGRGSLARSLLVTAQVALSLALVVAAGLLVRSFTRLNATSLGFDEARLLTGTIELPRTTASQRARFYRALGADLLALPGVSDVGFVSHLPVRDRFDDLAVWADDDASSGASRERTANMRLALPGYFKALGVPLLAGRDLAESDGEASARVLVISERMARTLFPGENAVGRRVTVASRPAPVAFEVVGVVGDARIDGVELPAPLAMYAPVDQFWETRSEMSFVVRTALPVGALTETVRRLVAARSPDVPMEPLVPMDAVVGETMVLQRTIAGLLGLLSAVALLLAVLGLYGLLAYHVAQRTRELGLRVALGASPRTLIAGVLARGAWMVVPGMVLGLAASWAARGLVGRLLHEVQPTDASAYGVALACLTVAALVACAGPAWRAARVPPSVALRHE